jgi:hypothetical protein
METKRKTGIRVDYTEVDGSHLITWTDIEGNVAPIVVNVTGLVDSIRHTGMMHGIDQKVTDAGAMGTDHWDGDDKPKRAATTGERMARMKRVADNLVAGNWNVRASADPLAGKSAEQLEALMAEIQRKLTAIGVSK